MAMRVHSASHSSILESITDIFQSHWPYLIWLVHPSAFCQSLVIGLNQSKGNSSSQLWWITCALWWWRTGRCLWLLKWCSTTGVWTQGPFLLLVHPAGRWEGRRSTPLQCSIYADYHHLIWKFKSHSKTPMIIKQSNGIKQNKRMNNHRCLISLTVLLMLPWRNSLPVRSSTTASIQSSRIPRRAAKNRRAS